MSGSKHFDKIAWIVTAITLVITILFMNGAALGLEIMAHTMGYETRLFDNTRVHTIDIVMNDWDSFIASATSEEYSAATVVIDGEAYKNVGIRGKGNTSLSNVASMDSDRYSFKIEFDQYDSSISYHGLDKLSLNNLIQDNTMMKDYLTYTMMAEFGVAAPLCSFAYITVNGEDWGLYLAVEGVEDSFLERNYGSEYGELYKPDSTDMGGGRGNGMDFDMDDIKDRFTDTSASTDTDSADSASSENTGENSNSDGISEIPELPEGMTGNSQGNIPGNRMPDDSMAQGGKIPTDRTLPEGSVPAMPDENGEMQEGFDLGAAMDGGNMGGGGGMSMGSDDVKLKYIDDNADSYSNIWNNAKTDITEADQMRLIESLKSLTNLENIENIVDIEQVIRYFVVHNYVCNGDSYTGSMIHNYYLYEENGQMAMIPWDYNLAFGTFQGANATSTVNTPIDTPVDNGSTDDRPMVHWIFTDETYTELYHQYFSEFLQTVDITEIIDAAYELIAPYVEKDPTKFCTAEEFELGVATLRQFCQLRSESVAMQLANGETANTMNYVDASGITLSDMGTMNNTMGGGKDMANDKMGNENNMNGSRGEMGGQMPGMNGETAPELPTGDSVASAPEGMSADIAQNQMPAAPVSMDSAGTGNTADGTVPGLPDGETMSENTPDVMEGADGTVPVMPNGEIANENGTVPGENQQETVISDGGIPGDTTVSESSNDESTDALSSSGDTAAAVGDGTVPEQPGGDFTFTPNGGNMGEQMQQPDMSEMVGDMGGMGNIPGQSAADSASSYILLGISIGILIIGLVVALLFKRR